MSEDTKRGIKVCIHVDPSCDTSTLRVAADRAEKVHALAAEIHAFVVGRSGRGHECLCASSG